MAKFRSKLVTHVATHVRSLASQLKCHVLRTQLDHKNDHIFFLVIVQLDAQIPFNVFIYL